MKPRIHLIDLRRAPAYATSATPPHWGRIAVIRQRGFDAKLGSLSCGAPGNCAATGWANVYVTATKVRTEGFVVSEVAGRWHFAQVVPGIVKLDKQGDSQGAAVACWSANHCAVGGFLELQGSSSPYPWVALER